MSYVTLGCKKHANTTDETYDFSGRTYLGFICWLCHKEKIATLQKQIARLKLKLKAAKRRA